jgi:hypothetical protein
MRLKRRRIGRLGVGFVLLGSAAMAAQPSDVADLVGIKGRDGESELQTRGYEFHHSAEAKDGKLTFWKNTATKTCIQVLTRDGRYAVIETAPAEACQSEPQ